MNFASISVTSGNVASRGAKTSDSSGFASSVSWAAAAVAAVGSIGLQQRVLGKPLLGPALCPDHKA